MPFNELSLCFALQFIYYLIMHYACFSWLCSEMTSCLLQWPKRLNQSLSEVDPELFDIIEKEKNRQYKVFPVSMLSSLVFVFQAFQVPSTQSHKHATYHCDGVLCIMKPCARAICKDWSFTNLPPCFDFRGWSLFPPRTLSPHLSWRQWARS